MISNINASTINWTINAEAYKPVGYNSNLPPECWGGSQYSIECLHRLICPQMHDYFISTGLAIIISYIVISWLLWAFFRWGYKFTPDRSMVFFGNFHIADTRIYWDSWIRNRLGKVMLGYIAVVVYMNW